MRSMRSILMVGAAALLLAIAPWPHAYYVGLRFLICGICIWAAYVALREGSGLVLPFVLAGMLFNPILPAQTTRAVWIVADLVVAAGFLAVVRAAPRLDAAATMDLDEEASQAAESS